MVTYCLMPRVGILIIIACCLYFRHEIINKAPALIQFIGDKCNVNVFILQLFIW